MTERDETLELVIETLKEPVTIGADLDARVLAAIQDSPPLVSPRARESWFARRWTVRVSPLGGLAAAAVVATLVLSPSLLDRFREQPAPPAGINESPAPVTQFVLVAPGAKSVALVGDFNDWSLSATRLVRQAGDGVWWVTVTLPPGRYRYAFIVDGTSWRSDPNAPAAEDDFGRPNSVVTIGGA